MRRVARKPALSAPLESSPAPFGGADIDGTEFPESMCCVVLCVCVCVCVRARARACVIACVLVQASETLSARALRPSFSPSQSVSSHVWPLFPLTHETESSLDACASARFHGHQVLLFHSPHPNLWRAPSLAPLTVWRSD